MSKRGRKMVERTVASWIGLVGLFLATPALAEGRDCPSARTPYSSQSLYADLMVEPRAVVVLEQAAPQALALFNGKAGFTLPPGFARILNPATVLRGEADATSLTVALDQRLRGIPVTRAAQLKRCASYDQARPTLPAEIKRPAILVFDKITGFRDSPSVDAASEALQAMARRRGWSIVTTDKAAVFNARDLARFDAVVWNNVSGDALTLPQRAAFRRWIEGGGGFAGFHGSNGDPVSIWPWYVDTLIGARFIGHPMSPQFQAARVVVEDRQSPITKGLGDWTMTEEWYSFGSNPRQTGAHVLVTLDERTYSPIGYRGQNVAMGSDHPIAWTRCIGKGRSFYSAIGHRPESYTEPNSLAILERGIAWAMSPAGDCAERGSHPRREQPQLGVRSAPLIQVDGLTFKDLDRDGKLQPYEDWRLTAQARAADLVGRMTLEEKAGTMMHGTAPAQGDAFGSGKAYDLAAAAKLIDGQRVTSFLTRLSGSGAGIAAENNKLQAVAERTRLGVPLTISTDPRNHFQHTAGASVAAGGFSKWPESLGFAAIGDDTLMRRFGDVARQEYRATGIHMALSPQADLATEPRWARINGTFGEDAGLASRMVRAYVAGFQAGEGGLTQGSVITVVKHWVGYGAAKDGWDSHNSYGRYASFPSGNFAYHLKPFEGAFAAKVAGVMPTYSILQDLTLDGKPVEQVAAGFNKYLLTDLLRGRYGFDGVILSDWGITNDCLAFCRGERKFDQPLAIGQPWGMDDLSETQRFAKALDAGVDQFGGTEHSERLVEIVRSGQAKEARLDQSVRRILIQKFQLGLFENPYVDPEAAGRIVGSKAFQAEGDAAQARSLVMLERKDGVLPLAAGRKVYLRGLDAAAATARGLVVVDAPEKADIAIIRTGAPHQLVHPNYPFGLMQHEGDLDFKDTDPDYQAIKQASAKVPTIVVVFLDRPAILTNVKDRASVLIGDFGVSDAVLLSVLAGEAKAEGHLPLELPSSMAAVKAQASDRPHDSDKPLYPFGYALGR